MPSKNYNLPGVDYAFPISLRMRPPRTKIITKSYIAIVVCFLTMAVQIEVVKSISTEAHLATLGRFIARRGKPKIIFTGNHNKFQGAANELHEIYKMLQSTSLMATIEEF